MATGPMTNRQTTRRSHGATSEQRSRLRATALTLMVQGSTPLAVPPSSPLLVLRLDPSHAGPAAETSDVTQPFSNIADMAFVPPPLLRRPKPATSPETKPVGATAAPVAKLPAIPETVEEAAPEIVQEPAQQASDPPAETRAVRSCAPMAVIANLKAAQSKATPVEPAIPKPEVEQAKPAEKSTPAPTSSASRATVVIPALPAKATTTTNSAAQSAQDQTNETPDETTVSDEAAGRLTFKVRDGRVVAATLPVASQPAAETLEDRVKRRLDKYLEPRDMQLQPGAAKDAVPDNVPPAAQAPAKPPAAPAKESLPTTASQTETIRTEQKLVVERVKELHSEPAVSQAPAKPAEAKLPPAAKAATAEKIPTDRATEVPPTEAKPEPPAQPEARRWNTQSLSELAESLRQASIPPVPEQTKEAVAKPVADELPVKKPAEAEAEPAEVQAEKAAPKVVKPAVVTTVKEAPVKESTVKESAAPTETTVKKDTAEEPLAKEVAKPETKQPEPKKPEAAKTSPEPTKVLPTAKPASAEKAPEKVPAKVTEKAIEKVQRPAAQVAEKTDAATVQPTEDASGPAEMPLPGGHLLAARKLPGGESGQTIKAKAYNIEPQYRAMRDNILEQLPADAPAVLLCTSADQSSPDQTPMLAELAVALTQKCEGNVLLVDAKLHAAGMSQYFGLESATGLAEVLQGDCSWQKGISQTALDRIHLLPSRVTPGMDFSLTMHANCDRLFDTLRKHYRFVLVDAAPVDEPSARALAAKCDATYLVAQFDGTPWRQAQDAIEQLAMVGARVLGSILTGVPHTDLPEY